MLQFPLTFIFNCYESFKILQTDCEQSINDTVDRDCIYTEDISFNKQNTVPKYRDPCLHIHIQNAATWGFISFANTQWSYNRLLIREINSGSTLRAALLFRQTAWIAAHKSAQELLVLKFSWAKLSWGFYTSWMDTLQFTIPLLRKLSTILHKASTEVYFWNKSFNGCVRKKKIYLKSSWIQWSL